MKEHAMEERENLLAEVQDVFRKELKLPDLVIKPSDTPADIAKWDSLRSMMILRKLETRFNVRIGVEKAMSIRSVGDLMAALNERMAHG
jgi:acyl carrier protein